jgi:putative ABC transport system permease protein
MSFWPAVSRGVRVLLSRRRADRDLDAEVEYFLDQARADAIGRGVPADVARRDARLHFGSPAAIREEVRSHGWEDLFADAATDVRYAWRGMGKRPGFAIIAVMTLAVGIGASTAIFSAVRPILFAPLPYPSAGRLILISDRRSDGAPADVAYGNYLEVAARSHAFTALAIADRWQPALVQLGDPERLTGDLVSADYFRVLGVSPAVGRNFAATDDIANAPRVTIVSDALARRRLGGAAAALGRSMVLDGIPFTVIGVMPRGFENVVAPNAELWTPRRYRSNAPFQSGEWGHHERMLGRIMPGISLAHAAGELHAIGAAPLAAYPRPPWADMGNGLTLEPLQHAVTREVRPALLAVLAAVALLLVIAAVNVTNLLLARGAQRQGEMAMRAMLGAKRDRLIRQLLTESVLLALAGGLAGIAVAAAGVRALVAVAPAQLPRVAAIRLDGRALLFALALTSLIGMVVGIAPALHGARRDLHRSIRSGARTVGATHPVLRQFLVIAEIGLALMVLVGAGLMLRSLAKLFARAPGFATTQRVTMQVTATGHRYDSDTVRYQFFTQALAAVRQVPGVLDAAFTNQLPLSGDADSYGFELRRIPTSDPNASRTALRYAVSPAWFETMGIPLRRGRLLNGGDRPGSGEAVVISESLARREFAGADPLGQQMRAGPEIGDTSRPWGVVVGVVGDVKQESLALDGEEAFYVATGAWPWVDNAQSLVVHTSGDPAAAVPAIERAIWSVDRTQPIIRVTSMAALLDRSESQRRFVWTVFAGFGFAALGLAAVGIFGLVSGGVTERLDEFGVRAALGASRGAILGLVFRQGLRLAGSGIVLGLAGAALVSGMLRTLLFGVSRGDLPTYAGAAVLVLLAVIMATAIPAWRAARVEPAVTLRR